MREMKCRAKLKMGDDYGDNEITFRCALFDGHEGPHMERNRLFEDIYQMLWYEVPETTIVAGERSSVRVKKLKK